MDLLYKYRNFTDQNHLGSIARNELFFASPISLNDPFDCKTTIDYSLLQTREEKEKYCDHLLQSVFGKSKISANWLSMKKIEILHRLNNDVLNLQAEHDSTSDRWVNERFGIISLSKRWDSILMWSHYSQNHTGFCIGYDTAKISQTNVADAGGLVQYVDEYPRLHPLASDRLAEALSIIYLKAKDWIYEEEYRLMKLWPDTIPTKEDRLSIAPENSIQEVILGIQTSKNDIERIQKIVSGTSIQVYKAEKRPKSFLLQKRLVSSK